MSSLPEFVDQVRRDFSGLLSRFEKAWEDGGEPEIGDFLAMEAIDDREVHQQLLLELVKIDIASRWQRSVPKGGDLPDASGLSERTLQLPRIERYIVEWPEIGPADSVDIGLIVHEYRVRHHFGDRPGLQEYETRFPVHGETLSVSLEEVETEFREIREGSTAPGMDGASVETNQAMGTLLPGAGGSEPTTGLDELPTGAAAGSSGLEPMTGNFGNYDLQKELGRGSMGIVYLARQLRPDRLVALKMISRGKLATAEQIRTFFSEADSAGSLKHPHIVTVYDSGEVDGQHYFSMAFIEGKSLDEILEPGETLDPRRAAGFIRTTAKAIEYAHSMGVLHRDLKPGNILIDEKDQPHVADFGIASRQADDSTRAVKGDQVGTPSYMPPEQAQGQADLIGPASDVYSLGATLYFLLTGVAPFGGGSGDETMTQVVEDVPAPPRKFNRSVDRYLQAICLKCLAKKTRDRYASAQELADDLGRYLRNEPTVALSPPAVIRFSKWCRRNPLTATLSLTITVILSVVSVVMTLAYLELEEMHGNIEVAKADLALKQRELKDANADLTTAETEKGVAEKLRDKAKDAEGKAKDAEGKAKDARDVANADRHKAMDSEVKAKKKLRVALADLGMTKAAETKLKAKLAESATQLAANERKRLAQIAEIRREFGVQARTLGENKSAKTAFRDSIEASREWIKRSYGFPGEQRKARLGLAETARLLGDLHADLEDLLAANANFQEASNAIKELKDGGFYGEDVQFSNAQLLNSQSVVLEIEGLLKEQLEELKQVQKAYEKLIELAPKAKKHVYTQKLARTHFRLGTVYLNRCYYRKKREWSDVEREYNEAVRLLRGLRKDSGEDRDAEPSVLQELAQTLQSRSAYWWGLAIKAPKESASEKPGRMKRANNDINESIELCQGLVERAPNNSQYKVNRIYAKITRAGLFPKDQDGNAEAEELYKKEIKTLEAEVKDHPLPSHRVLLARARENFGLLYEVWEPTRDKDTGFRVKQALVQYDAAHEVRTRLFDDFKGLARYRFDLARSLRKIARARLKVEDRVRAVEAAKKALGHIKELRDRFSNRIDYQSEQEALKLWGRQNDLLM